MLILTRRIGEKIRVGDEIECTLLSINGHQVRIGINAPKTIIVDREEIFQRKKLERETNLLAEQVALYLGSKGK